MAKEVIAVSGDAYPELREKQETIQKVIKIEEERFDATIDQGLNQLNAMMREMKEKDPDNHIFSGEEAFKLYDTFGFPFDLTKEIVEEQGYTIPKEEFDDAMNAQRERARTARAQNDTAVWADDPFNPLGPDAVDTFVGYQKLKSDAEIIGLIVNDELVQEAHQGDDVLVLLDQTPFYAQSGGQVGDTGRLESEDGSSLIEVNDCRYGSLKRHIHYGKVVEGDFHVGQTIYAHVDEMKRYATARNHTSTHMLQKALKMVLGDHVEQAGSFVSPTRLRFDFNHFQPMTKEEIKQVEEIVNQAILKAMPVETLETEIDKAKEMGAMALFGEKYGHIVRVVKVGDYSIELCGGTHLQNSAQAGMFKIISESGVAAGIRRIEATTGMNTYNWAEKVESVNAKASAMLKASPDQLIDRLQEMEDQLKEKDREIASLKHQQADSEAGELLNKIQTIQGVKVLIAEVKGDIPDTIRYNGKRLVGGSVIGRVPSGRYETRYVGFSELGENLQLAGPVVRTDSARPVINAFEVLAGEDVLDRVFTVHANVKDVESGIARVVVSSKLGNASRAPLELVPDSLGNVMGMLRLTRSELAKCGGCKLSLEMRAEDYGHNHTERVYESGKLYQYPTELALWYPSREGSGMLAYEYVGTGHHLNLDSVKSPWMGDAGIYFSMPTDRAAGVGSNAGRVNLGTSNSYSFETRIKVGYSGAAGWHRVLGFKGDDGLEMELLVHNRKLRLRESLRTWETPDNAMPVAKEWAHVVVTVDSSEVNFYVNGEIVKSAISEPLERKLDGIFSAGADGESSFVGHVADMRMYKKSLSGVEVFAMSQPVVDDKIAEPEIVEIVTVPMITVDGGNGFEPEFSCAVAGNRYFESTRDRAKLTMDALIEKNATYKVMMYARSATLQSANVSVSPSEGVRYAGRISASPVWRTVAVSDISMNLSAGMHTITLEAPEGLQVAGFALVTENVPATSIAWNAGLENPERKVKTFVRYEGFADKKILQPRVRLKNISGSQINGYSVRYYFRGEESSMAKVHAYYPHDTTGLTLHSESARTGFAEWKFENGIIPAYGMVFNGDGPHFGIHYEDWTPWNPYDDPSFVENAVSDFVEDEGIIVLDADKRLIGGSCVEMEDSVSVEVRARVFAIETRNDNSASEFHLKVVNVGNVTLKNYDVRYYFFLEGGIAPLFDTYGLPDGVSASLENIGEGRWQVSLHASKPLVSGSSWKKNVQIVLHCENWNDIWNASDDPGRVGFGREMVEAVGVNVFDSLGNRIYGNEPVWPEVVRVVAGDSSNVPDYGLKPKDEPISVHRTDDGLVIELSRYTAISLSLVNAVGVPVKDLYEGTVAPGEQFIRIDWTGIDMNRTYLMLRVNGAIKSTKLLSLL